MQIAQLPYLDEHTTTIAAAVDDVWAVLLEAVDRGFTRSGAGVYARAVGCTDCTASGPRPLTVGSTIPGFRVTTAVPGSELVLEGRHRFSNYALVFHLEAIGSAQSRLSAESHADFPGPAGRVYRLLVVGSSGHVRVVQHMLRLIKRRTEATARPKGRG